MKHRIAADTKQYWFEPNTAHAKKNLIINETAYRCGYETVRFEPNTAHPKPTIYQISKTGGKNLTNLIIHEQHVAEDAKQYWSEPNTAHTKTSFIINETEYS
jgi:hypothetical protein